MICIKIFDTHCDTVFEMQKSGLPFDNDWTHITQDQIKVFDEYRQMFAIWSHPSRTGEENWCHYNKVKQYYDEHILCKKSKYFFPYLAVEGGDLLNNDITRLDALYADGVRMITMVWRDECCIGGAHNTDKGLTPFGKEAAAEMFRLGIVPDISHASDKMAYQLFELSETTGKPICASHSDSRAVRDHTRNLTDDMFLCIKTLNGLVGLNLCCDHLEDTDISPASISSIIRHLEHYLSLGGENTVCLGCDFDGIDRLPDGIHGVSSLKLLGDELKKLGYSNELVEKIFFKNAYDFFEQN